MQTNKPTVSVCMITYNHEQYIQEAINGVLAQQTNFDIELLISNDNSTDQTHQKILNLTKNLPSHITLSYYNQERNLGMTPNFIFALKHCQGKYIALCEGDDYWIDPLKLQKQVDFLELNLNYNLICSGVRRYYQNSNKTDLPNKKEDYTFNYKDMIIRNHCHTCTTLIRNQKLNFSNWANDKGSDSQLWLRTLGTDGLAKYASDITAVYRKHSGGVSVIAYDSIKTYEDEINAFKRKISKAIYWNDYFLGNAGDSVYLVKLKMTKRMYRYAIRNNRYLDCIKYLFVFFKLKYLKIA